MTAVDTNPAAVPRVRWFHWVTLIALLVVGAGLRFHQITKVGLWPDEFWSSVHLATGRGTALFDLPAGVLFNPPPPTLFENAPHWWHIWTGLRGIIHPPVYLILLRWWIDLFGSDDFSTRAFSALASLAGMVVLFDILRRTVSPLSGLIAAALMAISPLQINLSQETRPYPLLALVGLLACHALFRIERQGASPARLFQLGLFATATGADALFLAWRTSGNRGLRLPAPSRSRSTKSPRCLVRLGNVRADRLGSVPVATASAVPWPPTLVVRARQHRVHAMDQSRRDPIGAPVRPHRKYVELDRSRHHRISAPPVAAPAISANSILVALDRGNRWIARRLRFNPPWATAWNDQVRFPGIRGALRDLRLPDSSPEVVTLGRTLSGSGQHRHRHSPTDSGRPSGLQRRLARTGRGGRSPGRAL